MITLCLMAIQNLIMRWDFSPMMEKLFLINSIGLVIVTHIITICIICCQICQKFSRMINPIAHHMVFSKDILEDLFRAVEEREGEPFWKVFLSNVQIKKEKVDSTGASEYLIYYHFCNTYHSDKIALRSVKAYNHAVDLQFKYPSDKYDFISCHKYLDRRK